MSRLRLLPKRPSKPRKVISLDSDLALADYSSDGRVTVACVELAGHPAWVVMRHDDDAMVGAAPGVELGVLPLIILAAKGAAKAVSAMAKQDPATGLISAPAPPTGWSYGLVPASQAQAAPAEMGLVPVRMGEEPRKGAALFAKVAKLWPFHRQGQNVVNAANANGAAGSTVSLQPAPQGFVWALQPAAGTAPAPARVFAPAPAPAPEEPPSAAPLGVPRSTAMRRGTDALRQTGILDEPAEDDLAGLVDPRAYDTDGNGVHLRTGRKLDKVDFRLGDRVDS